MATGPAAAQQLLLKIQATDLSADTALRLLHEIDATVRELDAHAHAEYVFALLSEADHMARILPEGVHNPLCAEESRANRSSESNGRVDRRGANPRMAPATMPVEEFAAALGLCVRTLMRRADGSVKSPPGFPLPLPRLPRGRVFYNRAAAEAWMRSGSKRAR